jgi:branched-chain amino acid aminotransferase
LFGSGAKIGLQPSEEYTFIVLVIPVSDYYGGGLKPVQAFVLENFDQAAPNGIGNTKVAGNYAADLQQNICAQKAGYPICLYLDSLTKEFIEEFSTSNFLAIERDTDAYVTPESDTILPSITNKSLMQIAESEGRMVFKRPIRIEEVMADKFSEVAACGTAVVVTPVNRITYKTSVFVIGNDDVGSYTRHLYNRVRAVQCGEEPDVFGWMTDI